MSKDRNRVEGGPVPIGDRNTLRRAVEQVAPEQLPSIEVTNLVVTQKEVPPVPDPQSRWILAAAGGALDWLAVPAAVSPKTQAARLIGGGFDDQGYAKPQQVLFPKGDVPLTFQSQPATGMFWVRSWDNALFVRNTTTSASAHAIAVIVRRHELAGFDLWSTDLRIASSDGGGDDVYTAGVLTSGESVAFRLSASEFVSVWIIAVELGTS
jgi:hypothetical protein